MRKLLLSLLLMFLMCYLNVTAQEKDMSVVIKGGQADYNASIGNFGGGGHSYYYWKLGPQFSAGIERQLNSSFSIQGLFVYSIHSFDERYSWGERVNNAKNSVYDLMGNIKLNISVFYLLCGIGFSYQNSEEVRYLESNQYHNAATLYPAKDKFVFTGSLGLGFDVKIYQQFSAIAEADINMREYMGTSLLIGIKYSLTWQ